MRAVVVGDFMLDQMVYGDAERLTADAPVPVLHVRRTEETPGGAASVSMDLRAFWADVRVFGVVGDDADGRLLAQHLAEGGIDASGLVSDASRPTTVKRNLIGLAQHRHPQKMFRVDFESREPVSEAVQEELIGRVARSMVWAEVVALEDYGKGVCTGRVCRAVIEMAREAGVEVLVDPASGADYARYRGCTAVTPNRTEAELATRGSGAGAEPESMARRLSEELDADAVVLTLDREGALLLERGSEPVRAPTVARQVYDVTGAGDMVLAALAAGRANGLDWAEAVRVANAAAGLEVEVFGARPIPFERVHQAVMTASRRPDEKHRTLDEAVVEAAAARREGRTIVFTNGCFDILHVGHIELLRSASRFGDVLVVGINSDDSVRALKGPDRPVHGQADRVRVLSELASVGMVVVFGEETPMRVLEALKPDVLVKGGDYDRSGVVGGDFVESYGGRVELVPLVEGRSTSGAIERIRSS